MRKFSLLVVALSTLLSSHALISALPALSFGDLFNLNKESESSITSRSTRNDDTPACGYTSCPETNPNKINVHIIAHSHDDVGWLKTVDQYYYGTNMRNAAVGVQHILDSLIPQLVMDKSKRFIYVEMSFFSKWWDEQDASMKTIVRRLVNEGRLEFINGGWCMNDEATVTYASTIEQMTLGLKFLNETFGSCAHPKVGWQIDPFGHSNEQASLFAQFGFDGMFFTRISYEDKKQRTDNKTLDFIWHGDRVLNGQSGSIFTNIFRDTYDSPFGYCFDALCQEDNLVDNKKSYEYNIDQRGQKMINFMRDYAKQKMTNHVLIPFGGDFHFSAAGQNFKNIDKLIKYIRTNAPDINIFYSTPSCYQYSVYQVATEKSLKLPEKYDDFMPYDSTPTVWWSGYFSSRPSVKLVERENANLLQVSRLISMANLLKPTQVNKNWIQGVKDHEAKCLVPLWEILGDLQHHDAVTGTEKQHVADDYVRRAAEASHLCAKFIGDLRRTKINEYLKRSPKYEHLRESGKKYKLDPVYLEGTMLCPSLNISQCDAMESEVDIKRYINSTTTTNKSSSNHVALAPRSKRANLNSHNRAGEIPIELATRSVLLNVYNPLAKHISQYDIRLPCNGQCDLEKVRVIHLATNETMKLIRFPVPSGIATLPFRDAMTMYEILFYANVPPLGYTSFIIEDSNNDEIVDEENEASDAIIISEDQDPNKAKNVRSRRIRRKDEVEVEEKNFEYFTIGDFKSSSGSGSIGTKLRARRDTTNNSDQNAADRVIVKFDMSSGVIVGLKRVSDGSTLNITQKFGYYYPANADTPPGAYIFRANSSEPVLMDKPILYKLFKRKNGAYIEIHQKWANWLWQTIKVDAKKNYIEFDYVVGPIPIAHPRFVGREVITRYITNMVNSGVFLTDSADRQLLTRHRMRSHEPEQVGGSFFPVTSTIMIKSTSNSTKCHKCSADTVAILVDRAQAGTSLNDGQLELLIHRRHTKDDRFGVGEALDEPGEDGRGLVTRGKHRMYLKFQESADSTTDLGTPRERPKLFKLPDTPRKNLDYEKAFYNNRKIENKVPITHHTSISTYIVHDQVYNDLNQESKKHMLKPTLTFDRLRVTANEILEMIAPDGNTKVKTDLTLLNTTLPNNVHLLTLQPWSSNSNEVLIRLENLDNPLTVHPFPDYESYHSLVRAYRASSDYHEVDIDDTCAEQLRPRVEVDIEYLLKRMRIVSLTELNLGANARLKDDKRINWTDEIYDGEACEAGSNPTSIKLAPRQIRTFLARFEYM